MLGNKMVAIQFLKLSPVCAEDEDQSVVGCDYKMVGTPTTQCHFQEVKATVVTALDLTYGLNHYSRTQWSK